MSIISGVARAARRASWAWRQFAEPVNACFGQKRKSKPRGAPD
jgi:hypothetical protein